MGTQKELLGASTRLLLLSVLAKEPNYGYQIVKSMNDNANGLFEWQEGAVYPLLHKLELEGLVRSQWQHAETGRQRKYYYITAAGRDSRDRSAREWMSLNDIIVRMQEVHDA